MKNIKNVQNISISGSGNSVGNIEIKNTPTFDSAQNKNANSEDLSFINTAKNLLAKGEIEDAVDMMLLEFNKMGEERLYNDCILLSGKLNILLREVKLGIINDNEKNIQKSKIIDALLSLL